MEKFLCFLGLVIVCAANKELQQAFLDAHNEARDGEGVGLPLVAWDEELEDFAKINVATCELEHDARGKNTTKFKSIGQNIFWASSNKVKPIKYAKAAVRSWMSEKQNYILEESKCKPEKICGHYTQVVWNNTHYIGCAVSEGCENGHTVTCNYGPAGNYWGEAPYVYKHETNDTSGHEDDDQQDVENHNEGQDELGDQHGDENHHEGQDKPGEDDVSNDETEIDVTHDVGCDADHHHHENKEDDVEVHVEMVK